MVATQCPYHDNLLELNASVRMKKKGDLSDFAGDMVDGVRQTGQVFATISGSH